MKILITGASGFIGSHLVKHFSRAGHEVTAFCRTPRKISSLALGNVRVVQGLIEDFAVVDGLVKDQEAVIHCALGWGTTAVEMMRLDTLPAVHLFERAIAAKVRKIVHTSSSVAVGEYRTLMDEDSVCRPLDLYSATKAATEAYLLALSRSCDTECNIIRPIYTFGEPAATGCTTQPDRRFWNFAQAALEGRDITLIKNDGTQLMWIGDLVRLYEHFLQSSCTRAVVNAGSDRQYCWQDIAAAIITRLRSPSRLVLEDTGWRRDGSLWCNARMKAVLPGAGDCSGHLEEHIDYVCSSTAARVSAPARAGVVA
jgi:UDP-glucose 4-epimerase